MIRFRSEPELDDAPQMKMINKLLWLSIPITVLGGFAAGYGVFAGEIYSASSIFVAGLTRGVDLVTLATALPVLIISAVLASKGSNRALLVWLGSLVFIGYTYMMTAFMVTFNQFFLVYVALIGLAAAALAGGLTSVDFENIKHQFSSKAPVKAVSLFFSAVVLIFYPVWLLEIIPAHLTGSLPRMIAWSGTPSHAYYILDLALLFPALAFTAFWLSRRKAIGYVLGAIALVFQTFEALAIISGMAFVASGSSDYPIFPEIYVYISGALLSFGMLVWYLRELREQRQTLFEEA